MSKVITLPISGSMHISHSKKLEMALRDFITSNDGTYYDDEIEKGILRSYFELGNGICVEQKVQIRKNDYICYTTLSCILNDADVANGIRVANSINREINYGHFEVNEETGEIFVKTIYEPDSEVYLESLDKLLGYPMYTINKHGNGFLKYCK